MQEKGAFVISLDFELLWGVFDKVDYTEKKGYFLTTRRVISEILDLFQEYNIHCTWATVGMIFNQNWKEWNENIPHEIPDYNDIKLSPYRYGDSLKSPETEDFCFAPDLIKKINEAPGQELATHTYSHYYCLEPGQGLTAFKADLEKAVELARKVDVELKSLVFPRNQFNADYLKICSELGIENVRSNPDAWYWRNTQKDSFQDKLFRTGDAYVGFNNKSYDLTSVPYVRERPLSQKASRLLRPYSDNIFLNRLKIRRVKSEMSAAARRGEIYHLWWHPHNFGANPQKNLKDLREILNHFKKCSDRYKFQSLNMQEVSEIYRK